MKVITEKALLKKWEAMLEHKNAPTLHTDRDAIVMAKVLEEQSGWEMRNAKKLYEGTYADPSAANGALTTYKPILVPMMRRIQPHLISMKVFGVQPMNGPTGIVFALRAGLQGSSESNRGTTRKQSNVLVLADASAFAIGDAISGQTSGATGTVIHKENNSLFVHLDSAATEFVVGESVDDANPFVGAETTVASRYIISYSDPDETNEALFKFVFRNYSYYDSLIDAETVTTGMKEVGFDITQTTVTAKTQKLKARLSLELEEDYQAIHGETATSELNKILADEIALEQNMIFIDAIYTKAELNPSLSYDYVAADGRWLAEKAQNAISVINNAAFEISESTKRGEGNFVIATKKVINLFKDSGRLVKTDEVVNMNGSFVGKLDGTFDLYNNMYRAAGEDSAVVGYIGGDKDAGIFHCPYVGLTPIRTTDPENGNPILMMRSRWGMLDNPFGARAYYRKINFARLP